MDERAKIISKMRTIILFIGTVWILTGCAERNSRRNAIVIQTDFGMCDGAVAAMKGVAFETDATLPVFDLTHEIPAYNVWEAAYRLQQTIAYWPAGTVFVSVVDPGVGTERQSVVAKTRKGHYIVTPDNGTLTLIAESDGIEALRQIDEAVNRRTGSGESYTFHGRDVYVYTAARLASGKIGFDEVGTLLQREVVKIPHQAAQLREDALSGNIPVLDPQYGNVWSNIPASLVSKAGIRYGDSLHINIYHDDSLMYSGIMPLVHTFGEVPEGKPLAYFNSLMNLSVALNMADFAQAHGIASGAGWTLKARTAN